MEVIKIYTILMTDDKELIISNRSSIHQNENLVDALHFLVPQTYGEHMLSEFKVYLQYVTPANIVVTENLTLSNNLYKGMLEYKLPINTQITSAAGEIQKLHLTFKKSVQVFNENGEGTLTERTLTTNEISVEILPSTDYRDFIIQPLPSPNDDGYEVVEF